MMQPMMGELIMGSIDASVVEMMGELQLVLSWSRYQDDAPEDESSNDALLMEICHYPDAKAVDQLFQNLVDDDPKNNRELVLLSFSEC